MIEYDTEESMINLVIFDISIEEHHRMLQMTMHETNRK